MLSLLKKSINRHKTSAGFIINNWEVAIVRAKSGKSNRPLEELEEMIFEKILIK
ncbi:MAG TPA: hypothetical protein PLH53_03075 [Ignavibacteriaceae bacterium]|nr:hypothetical protein [Ignavibacteriaceae bacterium]